MGLDISIVEIRNRCKCCGRGEDIDTYEFRKINFLVAFWENYYGNEMENVVKYPIDRIFIEALLEACTDVMADHSKAEDLLPTRGGFFFGDTGYGEKYFKDVEYVADTCKRLLDDFETDPTIECDIRIWY